MHVPEYDSKVYTKINTRLPIVDDVIQLTQLHRDYIVFPTLREGHVTSKTYKPIRNKSRKL